MRIAGNIILLSWISMSLGVKMGGGETGHGNLLLSCYKHGFFSLPLTSVYWRRNNTNVLKSTLTWFDHVYPDGEDLRDDIRVYTFWGFHTIHISEHLDKNFASRWSCSSDDVTYTQPRTFTTGNPGETIPAMKNDGNLTLTVTPESPVENSFVTLTCSTDTDSEWGVMWTRNNSPLLLTTSRDNNITGFSNSSLSNSLNISVSTSKSQQNLSILVTEEFLQGTEWYCKSDVALNASNTVIITTTVVTATPAARSGREDTTFIYVVIAAVCGTVIIVVIIALLIRGRNHHKTVTDQHVTKSQLAEKPSLVTQENILYSSTSDDNPGSGPPDSPDCLMQDNVLYSSSSDHDDHTDQVYSYPGSASEEASATNYTKANTSINYYEATDIVFDNPLFDTTEKQLNVDMIEDGNNNAQTDEYHDHNRLINS